MNKNQQFYKIHSETGFNLFISFLLAVFLVKLFLPQINNLLDKEIHLISNFKIWGIYFIFILLISFLTSFFESVIISRIYFINALKGQISNKKSGKWIKKTVLITQYIISIALIFFTMVVFFQTRYHIIRDLGINKNNVLVLNPRFSSLNTSENQIKEQRFLDELKKMPEIRSASYSNAIPGVYPGMIRYHLNDIPEEESTSFITIRADENFLETYKIQLIAGENLKPKDTLAINDFLIDSRAAQTLGFQNPADAVGNFITRPLDKSTHKIVGVVKNFDLVGFDFGGQEPGKLIMFDASSFDFLSVNYTNTDPMIAVKKIQSLWKSTFNENALYYFFLNDSYRKLYKSEITESKLFSLFSLISVLIASFGLFAMAFETIVQRTKEIGIRKVNGAKTLNILVLLFREYIGVILISVIPGLIIAYYISYKWLEDFYHRISISWYIFILPILIITFITSFSVIYHSIKAAFSKPVDTLKYE